MLIFILRHPESDKNIGVSFSTFEDDERLTIHGKKQSKSIAKELLNVFISKRIKTPSIHCANSIRCITSAEIISKIITTDFVIHNEFVSTKAGKLAGVKEEDAKKTNPNFINQLYLYRKGLFSAYDFQVAEGKEPKNIFEKRVLKTFNKLINEYDDEKNIMIISHRSPITTILTYIAKKYYGYPKNFLGYVPLDLGYISIIEKKSYSLKLVCINESVNNINKYL